MAQVTLTNDDFQDGETITDTKIDNNFDDLKNAHNNHDSGASSWQQVKVSATVANPVDVTGSASSTEVSVNNTNGTDGDPMVTLKKSGVTKAKFYVDDSDSDKIKISDGTNDLLTLANGALIAASAGNASTELARYEQVKVLQVVAATSTTAFTTTSATFQATNLSASITPVSTSNKVLVLATGIALNNDADGDSTFFTIARGGGNLGGTGGFFEIVTGGLNGSLWVPCVFAFLDSPVSTSALTYDVRIRNSAGSVTVGFGKTNTTQSIILLEVNGI